MGRIGSSKATGRVPALRASPGRRVENHGSGSTVRPRIKVWVVFDDAVKFGDGRARLLESIRELGSFKKAVSRIGMSYRAAWGYFQELERAAGTRLLERHPGGGPEGGTRLTPEGQRLLERYWTFRRGLEEVAERHFARSFKTRPR
jgi:molybdate transport system regulatory protein